MTLYYAEKMVEPKIEQPKCEVVMGYMDIPDLIPVGSSAALLSAALYADRVTVITDGSFSNIAGEFNDGLLNESKEFTAKMDWIDPPPITITDGGASLITYLDLYSWPDDEFDVRLHQIGLDIKGTLIEFLGRKYVLQQTDQEMESDLDDDAKRRLFEFYTDGKYHEELVGIYAKFFQEYMDVLIRARQLGLSDPNSGTALDFNNFIQSDDRRVQLIKEREILTAGKIIKKIGSMVVAPEVFPLIHDPQGLWVPPSARPAGELVSRPSQEKRADVELGTGLIIAELPGIADLTPEMVVHLREELRDYLIPFRRYVGKMSTSLKDVDDPVAVAHDVRRVYELEVKEAIEELRERIDKNTYLGRVRKGFKAGPRKAVVAALTLGIGDLAHMAHLPPEAIVGGSVLGAVTLGALGIKYEVEEEDQAISKEGLLFLAKLGRVAQSG